MRRFIILNILFVLSCLRGMACAGEYFTHDTNVFNIFYNDEYDNDSGDARLLFQKQLVDYWLKYVGESSVRAQWKREPVYSEAAYFFENNCKRLFAAARRKGDVEMETYLKETVKYNRICEELSDVWEYPTKQQLTERKRILRNMQTVGLSYKGTRMKAQYALLYMRANLLLGEYATNRTYWLQTAADCPKGVYRDMMRSLYANALLHTGAFRRACDIYVEQGDWVSVRWALRKYRNIAGIQTIYKEDPNSPALTYLVQYFINGSNSCYEADPDAADDKAREDDRVALLSFIEKDVLHHPAVRNKAMWLAVSAMLYYDMDSNDEAWQAINKAMQMQTDTRTKNSIRCIRLLISTAAKPLDNAYYDYLSTEFVWLIKQGKEQKNAYFNGVLDRIVYNELKTKLYDGGQKQLAVALIGMMDELSLPVEQYEFNEESSDVDTENSEYHYFGWEYTELLDEMTADELRDYFRYIAGTPANAIERFAFSRIYKGDDMFNDLIGTKYIARGDFATALTYLERVSMKNVNAADISFYADGRDYEKERWFVRQRAPEQDSDETADRPNMTENPKVNFCREMLQLERRFSLAREGEAKRGMAYDLATRYYQASCYGDCWYLTHNTQSWGDSARVNEKDFAATAIAYLNISKKSKDKDLQAKSLFAIAYICYQIEVWGCTYEHGEWFSDIPPYSPVYPAYRELAACVRRDKTQRDYITHCDILQEFMNSN